MRVVVSGGGTGGHIYPAVSVSKAMKELLPSAKILFVGTSSGMEKDIVPKENIEFATIRSSGIVGKSLRLATRGMFMAAAGLKDALNVLKKFRPDVVLGTGGYVSGPCILAAKLLGIPAAIQEQNAIPGKTNLVLSRFVDRTFLGWEYSRKFFPKRARLMVTGNPVKSELLKADRNQARQFFGLRDGFTLLVLGGSRGASTLCEIGLKLVKEASEGTIDFQVIFITGREYYQKVMGAIGRQEETGIEGQTVGNIIIRPYVYNMEMAYGASDLVLARAGGMTLAEITALGLPSVIIPSPNVVGNHQEYNARALEEKGAAVVIREDGHEIQKAFETIVTLSRDNERLRTMSLASQGLGHRDAAVTIARELIRLSRKG